MLWPLEPRSGLGLREAEPLLEAREGGRAAEQAHADDAGGGTHHPAAWHVAHVD